MAAAGITGIRTPCVAQPKGVFSPGQLMVQLRSFVSDLYLLGFGPHSHFIPFLKKANTVSVQGLKFVHQFQGSPFILFSLGTALSLNNNNKPPETNGQFLIAKELYHPLLTFAGSHDNQKQNNKKCFYLGEMS